MSARDRAGVIVQIVTNGTLSVDIADIFDTYGPCDALKADANVTMSGLPADGIEGTDEVAGYKFAGTLVWDPAGWASISAVTTSGNVWAAWYSRRAVAG